MATIADGLPASGGRDDGFFRTGAFVMTAAIVAGFLEQMAMGRSSFAVPLLVHAHAVVFMGWVAIYLLQNVFATTGRIGLHRRLGWIAVAWMVPMVVLGCMVTLAMVRGGRVPFFFRPLQFLVFDPATMLTFVGLTIAAILLRRQTDWHRRLHFCGMTMLLGPGVARLLPTPLAQPWAWEAVLAVTLLFPLAGMIADRRRDGRVHPAWFWGVGAILVSAAAIEIITYSPVGGDLYRAVTAGSPGAAIAPLAFGAPPPG